MDEGVAVLEEKVRRWKPEVVCVVGKGIWESVHRVRERERERHGKAVGSLPKDWKYGWQDESENMGVGGVDSGDEEEETNTTTAGGEWKGARVFVATSTSGLAATVGRAEKERIWRELGEWVERRRAERETEKGVKGEDEDEDEGQSG